MRILPVATAAAALCLSATLFGQEPKPRQPKPQPADATPAAPASDAAATGSAAPVTGPNSTETPAKPAAEPGTPAPEPQLAPPPTTDAPVEPSLIPQVQTTFIKPPTFTQKQERKSKTQVAEDNLTERIHFREAKTKALTDAKVQEFWRQAQVAHTDYEKRAAMQKYYTALYDRMGQIDKSFPTLLTDARHLSIARVTQGKLEPSEPPVR